MKSNPSPKDRAQNLAIAYSIKRRNKMAQGGRVGGSTANNPKLEQAELSNPTPDMYSDAPDTTGCPVCNQLSKGTLCEEHGNNPPKNTSGRQTPEQDMFMHEGGQLDDQRSPDDEPNQELPADPQYDNTINPGPEVGIEMNLLARDEHGLKSEQLSDQAMMKRKIAKAPALNLAEGGMLSDGEQVEGKDASQERAKYRRMSEGGRVTDQNEYIEEPSNDFMKHPNEPEVSDPEHDSGATDEMLDESLSGQVLRKRKVRK